MLKRAFLNLLGFVSQLLDDLKQSRQVRRQRSVVRSSYHLSEEWAHAHRN